MLGADRIAAEPADAADFARLRGHQPLALRLGLGNGQSAGTRFSLATVRYAIALAQDRDASPRDCAQWPRVPPPAGRCVAGTEGPS